MTIIIYCSRYGTARKYAEEFGRKTGFEVKSYNEIDDINVYDTIVYFGALYAGTVIGVRKTFGKLKSCANKQIVIATVGLADPADEENISNIRNNIAKQISDDTFAHATILHFKGGIDYTRLGIKHKLMMAVAYRRVAGMPAEKRNAEARAIYETYNQQVDFTDFARLDEIASLI